MLEKNKTALLVIDMQNDNISAGGKSEGTGAVEHAQKQKIIPHISQLISAAHENNIPVIHNQFVVKNDGKAIGSNAPIFINMKNNQSAFSGTWGAKTVDRIDIAPEDFVLQRDRMSAFHGTELNTILKNLDIDTIIITGVWTNMAVEHTARDGADYGYKVIVVPDATATINDEWQSAAMNYAMNNVATKMLTEEIIKEL